MDTIIRRLDSSSMETPEAEEAICLAADILKRGGLVAFPTETVYGLGGDGLCAQASEKIYAAKGRPSDNPLILHIAGKESVGELAEEISEDARKLMDAFWPGPMTLIFKKKDIIPEETTGGLATVAIRCPNHPVAQKLIRKSGVYIAAPSANLSGRPSPTKAEHVEEDLCGRIDMILDGGQVQIGLESTIIDVSVPQPVILRPGYITKDMIEQVISHVEIDPAVIKEHKDEHIVAKAPGMKYRHYAPKGQLTLVEGQDAKQVIREINRLVKEASANGRKAAVIATEESRQYYEAPLILSIGTRQDENTIAHHLYDVLREMDEHKVDVIYSESFRREELGQAIMNRMLKAAGYHVLRL